MILIVFTLQDLSHSARFPANPWSYEACSTPPENSGHHHHVQPAYTAPVHHQPAYTVPAHQHVPTYTAPVHQVPAYTVPVHHAPVHHAPAHTLPVQQPNHIHSAYTGAHQDAGGRENIQNWQTIEPKPIFPVMPKLCLKAETLIETIFRSVRLQECSFW